MYETDIEQGTTTDGPDHNEYEKLSAADKSQMDELAGRKSLIGEEQEKIAPLISQPRLQRALKSHIQEFIHHERMLMEDQISQIYDESENADVVSIEPVTKVTQEEWLKMKRDLLLLDEK